MTNFTSKICPRRPTFPPYDLREELENAGLGSMKISSSDESLFSVAATTWRGFNSTVKSVVD